jgi:general secretion pathway protein A
MYLDFYELKEEPFRLTPDPKFLQLAEAHRVAMMTLAQGIVGRKGLMQLTGPIGTGKTTILNALLSVLARTYPEKTLPTALLVNPRLTRDELLEALLFEYEVSAAYNSKSCRIAALQGLMFAASKDGGTCLLIVDEAHLMSVDVLEEIRLLMNADTHRDKPLQVVLCGQPELSQLLRDPALRALQQRIAVRASLPELSQSETRMYISERLRIAGLQNPVPFSSTALERVYGFTGGVPRLINIMADTCLTIGYETKTAQIGEDIVEEAAARNELEVAASLPEKGPLVVLPPFKKTAAATGASRSEQ